MIAGIIFASLIAIAFACIAYRQRTLLISERQDIIQLKSKSERFAKQVISERVTLLDSLSQPLFLLDEQRDILYANTEAKNLLKGREVEGRNISEIFTDHLLSETISTALDTEEARSTRIKLSSQSSSAFLPDHEGGETAWIVDTTRLTDFGAGVAHRLILQNITDQHQAEQVRKDFVANASHELRTPLAIIDGYLENLIDDNLLEDKDISLRFLKIMRKHSDRISRIVEDMLVISRLESGEAASLNLEDFSISACLHDVQERLESVIEANRGEMIIDVSPADLQMHGDRFYWTQILFNLVENAFKQNADKPLTLNATAALSDTGIEVSVTDNGVGIPAADLPYIFKRFFRVQKHHNQSSVKGTGLGLSIVKRAVEAHGGSISAQSTPGQATTFAIQVPHTK